MCASFAFTAAATLYVACFTALLCQVDASAVCKHSFSHHEQVTNPDHPHSGLVTNPDHPRPGLVTYTFYQGKHNFTAAQALCSGHGSHVIVPTTSQQLQQVLSVAGACYYGHRDKIWLSLEKPELSRNYLIIEGVEEINTNEKLRELLELPDLRSPGASFYYRGHVVLDIVSRDTVEVINRPEEKHRVGCQRPYVLPTTTIPGTGGQKGGAQDLAQAYLAIPLTALVVLALLVPMVTAGLVYYKRARRRQENQPVALIEDL